MTETGRKLCIKGRSCGCMGPPVSNFRPKSCCQFTHRGTLWLGYMKRGKTRMYVLITNWEIVLKNWNTGPPTGGNFKYAA